MKKILVFLFLSIAAVSCYEDYIFDYPYTAIYFPYQIDTRTFVVGEGMKFQVGAALGGIRENKTDRSVEFSLDNTLINPTILSRFKFATQGYINGPASTVATLLELPASYYTYTPQNALTIKAGQHMGAMIIRPDSAVFLADPATAVSTYAIPFRITSADADSVIKAKNYAVIGVRYENMLFGKYWHGGSALINRPTLTDTTINYFTKIPTSTEQLIWTLTTASPNSLYVNAYYNKSITTKNEMLLTLDGTTVTVTGVAGSTVPITGEGTSSFNRPKLLQDRKIFIKYTYTDPGNSYTYHCTDTLTFRNRIRDGINEWQDENPSHYTK
jgi:hypothetical protein